MVHLRELYQEVEADLLRRAEAEGLSDAAGVADEHEQAIEASERKNKRILQRVLWIPGCNSMPGAALQSAEPRT